MSEKTVTVKLETLQKLFDLAVGSLDFGSGWWDTEDTLAAREIAAAIGADLNEATPAGHRKNFLHKFEQRFPKSDPTSGSCKHCSENFQHRAHRESE